MDYEEEVRTEFEKAKAKGDAWLVNFWGSSLMHINQVKQECKRQSDERRRRFDEIKENARVSAECKYLEAKMKCNIQKSEKRLDLTWIIVIGLGILAYFWLVSILCQ